MNRVNPQELGPDEVQLPSSSICPHCNVKLDITTGISGNNPEHRNPRPGDISICIKCGEPCQFGENMEMIKLSDELRQDVLKDPMIVKAMLLIKINSNQDIASTSNKYVDQIKSMTAAIKEWLKSGNKSPSIQYNFSEKTFVIATIEDAIDKHAISVNDDALAMFKDLGFMNKDQDGRVPTVFMLKMAMDNVFKETNETNPRQD